MIISEKIHAIPYPKLDYLINQLDRENNFQQWSAIEISANPYNVGSSHRFENTFNKYFITIRRHRMITPASTIKAVIRMAANKRHLAKKNSEEVLKVEEVDYESSECNNIVVGQAIKTLNELFPFLKSKTHILEFVQK